MNNQIPGIALAILIIAGNFSTMIFRDDLLGWLPVSEAYASDDRPLGQVRIRFPAAAPAPE